jgi:predicted cupin superfamily sugar epimerase
MSQLTARDVIFTLGLQRHPQGGWYAEIRADNDEPMSAQPRSRSIYYLLERGDRAPWHRVDAVEVWHYYTGAPLRLRLSDGHSVDERRIGSESGDQPQVVVPGRAWQSAESTGEWTLMGCTVAPGFQFSGFDVARNWAPGRRN